MKIKIILNDINRTEFFLDKALFVPNTGCAIKKWFRKPTMIVQDVGNLKYTSLKDAYKDEQFLRHLRYALERDINSNITYPSGRYSTVTRCAILRDLLLCNEYRTKPMKSIIEVEVYSKTEPKRILKLSGRKITKEKNRRVVKKLFQKKELTLCCIANIDEFWSTLGELRNKQ